MLLGFFSSDLNDHRISIGATIILCEHIGVYMGAIYTQNISDMHLLNGIVNN